jgi:hypothetical protein
VSFYFQLICLHICSLLTSKSDVTDIFRSRRLRSFAAVIVGSNPAGF